MATRTDCHRPGAIVPADYSPRTSFSLPRMFHGFPCPSMGLDCENDFREILTDAEGRFIGWGKPGTHHGEGCCVKRLREKHAPALRCIPGRCDVCGARYKEGAAFVHEPTQTLVLMGHDCAQKYELMFDASATEIERGRVERALAVHIRRAEKDAERAAFLEAHPGLAAAFELRDKHSILHDMHGRFIQWCSLSDKQVAFALKLADEIRNPPAKPAEESWLDVPAAKRAELSGVILAAKVTEGWGPRGEGAQFKMLLAAETPEGRFKVWSTIPIAALADRTVRDLKGMRVRVRVTVEPSRNDPKFGIGRRPTLVAGPVPAWWHAARSRFAGVSP